MNGAVALDAPPTPATLSPTRAALASASEKAAAKPGHVIVGPLRIRVLQAIDLPPPRTADNGVLSTPSWLPFAVRRPSHQQHVHGKPQQEAVPDMICVLLRTANAGVLATEARPWSSAICWDEEFYMEQVSSNDELVLFCVDRARQENHSRLPLQGDISACPGFIGKVCVPLTRLPEGEEVEQWYPLIPKESSSSLRTALRVSLCFVPNGVSTPSSQNHDRRRVTPTSALLSSPATEILSASPVSKQIQPASFDGVKDAIPLESGIIDYVIVVTPALSGTDATSLDEAQVRFRYPANDRPGFPLPTKIEWFCFPDGPEIITQPQRPQSKLFSFVLIGGDDGLCRCYVACLIVYHRRDSAKVDQWYSSCLAFLTRVPVMEEVTTCLLAVAHAWMKANRGQCGADASADTLKHLVSLCQDVILPVRGVFGVQFTIDNLTVRFIVPSMTSIYTMKEQARPELRRALSAQGPQASPRSFIPIQQGLQPLVYSLEPIFQLFDVKAIIYLVTLVLCEYRVLVHSTQQSLLCPVTEGLCALIYPFRWQHPYVPILPRVLSEYLQAPLPYILGVNSAWLQNLLGNGRPEHLVVVDVDRGTIQLQESGGPVLPHKLTRGLHHRLKAIMHPSMHGDTTNTDEDLSNTDDALEALKSGVAKNQNTVVEWEADTERRIRMEFVCFLASLIRGYRECLFFVNQKLPVFNKRRFFESETTDSELVPLVTRIFCTQSFQAFLENHSSAELSVFHSVYLTICRVPKELQWSQSMRALSFTKSQQSLLDTVPTKVDTPVLILQEVNVSKNLDGDTSSLCGEANAQSQETTPNHDEAKACEDQSVKRLGDKIDALLNEDLQWEPFALNISEMDAHTTILPHPQARMNHDMLARNLGVQPALLATNAHLLQNAHQVNQYRLHLSTSISLPGLLGSSNRFLSSEEERIEQMLHKCLTAVFTSDETISEEETRVCEANFKSAHARDLFVLILMQPSNQYVEGMSGSPKSGGAKSSSAWYNPKGSGSCIGTTGFRLLARLTSALMNQCAVHEDYTSARGILQVAPQYYHYVEDKHSGIGFAKKEYLVTPLRLLPICRSLDLWQHAFICEIDMAGQADPTESDEEAPETVNDELFFSVIGSLMYDMLNFEVPLQKVLTFVAVMCSTYQKGQDLLNTLKQLAENVYRALDMSKDIKPSPPKDAVQPRITAKSISNHASATPHPRVDIPAKAGSGVTGSPGVSFAESPMLSREYDLNTVIRRKVSLREMPQLSRPTPNTKGTHLDRTGNQHAADSMSRTPPGRRRRSSATFPSAVLANSSSPVLSLATDGGRAACGMADNHLNVVDIDPADDEKGIQLEGHADAVVAVQIRGNTLVSGSRDHTLRIWDLRATPKKRHMFSFFSLPYANANTGDCSSEVDGSSVSKRSLVMHGHLAAITCMELGQQLGSSRSLLVSGSDDGTVRLWETTRESSVALLSSHKSTDKPTENGGVSCLRLLASDDDLALGYRRRTMQIWDIAVSKLKVSVSAHHAGIRVLEVSGTRLVTAANDRVVKVWDTAFRGTGSAMLPTQQLRDHGGPVQCLSLGGPADPNICTGAADGLVRVWDIRYVQRGPRLTLRGHIGPITCLQRDFTKLVSAGEDGWLRVWDMHSATKMAVAEYDKQEDQKDSKLFVAASKRHFSTHSGRIADKDAESGWGASVLAADSAFTGHIITCVLVSFKTKYRPDNATGGSAIISNGWLEVNHDLSKQSAERQEGEEQQAAHETDISGQPILVAVRCRPRKRQRAEHRFTGEERSEEQRVYCASSSASSSSSGSESVDNRSSSGNVQRGVFEYASSRDYDYTATYAGALPPPSTRRPRRLFVQALTKSTGNVSGRRSFDFDFVFPPWKKQRDVYNECVQAQIQHVLRSQREGRQQHTTIVAYGQTGTGKTYTMGMLSDFTDDAEQGLIPRALAQILEFATSVNTTESETCLSKTVITLSFLQIYLETIQDLLALTTPGSNIVDGMSRTTWKARHHLGICSSDLPVRQGRDGAFYVAGLSEYEVSSIEDVHALLSLATRNRVLASTTKNKTSSRSHTLLTISLKARHYDSTKSKASSSYSSDGESEEYGSGYEQNRDDKVSTISFVDLAGSERVDGTLHFLRATRKRQELRIREAKFINRSLSALGGVIAALAQPKAAATRNASAHARNPSLHETLQPLTSKEREQHIRFRDSQLTKLLQGRLMGGRGQLLLIATVDDQPKNLSETLSTLKFATQCRRVELQRTSRLCGDRTTRSRGRQSLLDQVILDMKNAQDTREAALRREYEARIEFLERELESARMTPQSQYSTTRDAEPIHQASYSALCSLVDSICWVGGRPHHPRIDEFESQESMLCYIAGLYSRLKEVLSVQQRGQGEHNSLEHVTPTEEVVSPGTSSFTPTPQPDIREAKQEQVPGSNEVSRPDLCAASSPPLLSTTTSSTTCTSTTPRRMHLSAEREAEFRAVAKHLIASKALDNFVVSSSDEEDTNKAH